MIKYSLPTDEWAHLLTPTAPIGSVDPDYPLANLFNNNQAVPTKFTSTSARIVFDRGSAQAPALFAVFHHNLDGAVQILASDASDFSGTPESYPFTLAAVDAEGYYDNPFINISGPSRRYQALDIVGNSQNIILGGIWFASALRSFAWDVAPNFQAGTRRPGVPDVVTDADVEMSQPAFARRRWLSGVVNHAATTKDEIDVWQRATMGAGGKRSFLLVPFVTLATKGFCWLAKWRTGVGPAAGGELAPHQDFAYGQPVPLAASTPVGWMEDSPGRPWGTF